MRRGDPTPNGVKRAANANATPPHLQEHREERAALRHLHRHQRAAEIHHLLRRARHGLGGLLLHHINRPLHRGLRRFRRRRRGNCLLGLQLVVLGGALRLPVVLHEGVPLVAHHVPHVRQHAEVVHHHQRVAAGVAHALADGARRARREEPLHHRRVAGRRHLQSGPSHLVSVSGALASARLLGPSKCGRRKAAAGGWPGWARPLPAGRLRAR